MSFEEEMKLARYRAIMQRQEFFGGLRREWIGMLLRATFAVVAASVTLVGLKWRLEMTAESVKGILEGFRWIVLLAAVVVTAQVAHIEWKVFRLREAECSLNSAAPAANLRSHIAWFAGYFVLAALCVGWTWSLS